MAKGPRDSGRRALYPAPERYTPARRGAAAAALAALGYPVCAALTQALASGLLEALSGVPGASLAHPMGMERTDALLLWAAACGLALALPGIWAARSAGLRPAQLRLKGPVRRLRGAFALFLLLMSLVNLAGSLLGRALGLAPRTTLLPASGTALAASFLASAYCPPWARNCCSGVLQAALRPFGPGAAVWGTALLFALEHGSVSQCLTALAAGLFLGWYAEWCGSIWPGAAFHLCNNALAFWSGWLSQHLGEEAALLAQAAAGLLILLGCMPLWRAARAGRPGAGRPALPQGRRAGLRALLADPAYRLALAGLAVRAVWKCFW